ncbi:dihydrolipoamide acetyltransferase family protein [Jatrophihabitans fulvus]
MAQQVLVPKLGLTMETGLIEEWLVAPGTPVKVGDPLLRMGTDKVNVDVEAEAEGIFHPVVDEGADLPPGTLIAWLLDEGEPLPEGASASPASTSAAAPAVTDEQPAANPARHAAAEAPTGGRLFVSPNARRVAGERGVDVTTLRGTGPNGRIVTADVLEAPLPSTTSPAPSVGSPLVRRDAAAAGVDVASLTPSGPGGRVRRADVNAARQQPVAAPAEPGAPLEIIPLKGMRGVIASRMHDSLQTMAQLTHGYEVSMDAAVALRAQLKQQWSTVPTFTDLVVRAAALALREHPRLNATVETDRIVVHSDVNVGLAVALDEGLIVPVVRHADDLPLSALAAETKRLAAVTRSGQQTLADIEGGTFTVSTLGSYGVDFFTPVITPGQVAILGVGRLRDSVRWEGDTPRRTQVLTLSLTFDHRAVDGAPAAEYLRTVAEKLANPLSLLS